MYYIIAIETYETLAITEKEEIAILIQKTISIACYIKKSWE